MTPLSVGCGPSPRCQLLAGGWEDRILAISAIHLVSRLRSSQNLSIDAQRPFCSVALNQQMTLIKDFWSQPLDDS